jgi:hypothetical protein
MSICGGPIPYESRCKLKLLNRDVNTVSPTTLEYLRWSKSSIAFDGMNHMDFVPKLGRFPIIVNPLVGAT